MIPARLLASLAAIASLAASAALRGASTAPGVSSARDPGSALGGFRVLVADAWILRADALRREGRFEELPALYRQVLDLDPGNEDAIDLLALTEARDLRTLSPDDAGRVRWWRAARDLIERGLAASPDSARLHWRAADLLAIVPQGDPAVLAALAAEGVDGEMEGLRHLGRSVALAGSLGRSNVVHLDAMTFLAPEIAARRLARGPAGERAALEAVAIGRRALRARLDEFASFRTDAEGSRSGAEKLAAGLALVEAVHGSLQETPPAKDAARRLLDLYASNAGEDGVSRALRPLVR
jgi:hypothetical protein